MNHLKTNLFRHLRCLALAAIAFQAFVWLPVSCCRAGIIYSFNNYPDEQDGGTLSGNITVVETAASDGLLTSSEILDWRFTLSHPSLPTLTVDSITASNPSLSMSGAPLGIDSNHITMPATQFVFQDNIFSLANLTPDSTGYEGLIDWRRSIPGVSELYVARNGKGTPTLADDDLYWERSWFAGDPTLVLGGPNPWVIATAVAVPEPSSLLAFAAALIGYFKFRGNQRGSGIWTNKPLDMKPSNIR